MHGPLLHGLNLVSNFGCGIIDIGPILRCSTTSLKSSFTRTSIAPNAVLSPQKYHRIFAPCDSSHLKRSFARESTKRTLREHSENTQRALRAYSENTQSTPKTERTLREHPKLTRSSGWETRREILINKIVKIVKDCQNCQRLSKLSKIAKHCQKLLKLPKL